MSRAPFVIPTAVAAETLHHLRTKGAIGHEGVVLWRGTFQPPTISRAVVPVQQTGPGRFIVSLAERQRIARALSGTGEMIVAQVHSHPGPAFHSGTDDAEAIPRRIGSFSLVIPNYAERARLLDGAAVFQLAADGTWTQTHSNFEVARERRGVLRWLIDTLRSVAPSGT